MIPNLRHTALRLAPLLCASFMVAADAPIPSLRLPSPVNEPTPRTAPQQIIKGKSDDLFAILRDRKPPASTDKEFSVSADTTPPPAAQAPAVASANTDYTGSLKAEQHNGLDFYSTDAVFTALPVSIRNALSTLAGTDLLLADPDDFSDVSFAEWADLTFVKRILSNQVMSRRIFDDLHEVGNQTQNGSLYLSTRIAPINPDETAACIISGDTTAIARNIIGQTGAIPQQLLTPELMRRFPTQSLLTYTLLHEAAHCNQTASMGNAAYILRAEANADQQATAAYNALRVANPQLGLDATMPAKYAHLRALSSFMPRGASVDTAYANSFSGNRTHDTQTNNTNDDTHSARLDSQSGLIALTVYAGVDQTTRANAEQRSRQLIQIMQRKERDAALRTMSPQDVATILPSLLRFVERTVAGTAIQSENPEYTYYAARILMNGTGQNNPEETAFVRQNMSRFVTAWQALGLPQNDVAIRSFSNRLNSAYGTPLNVDLLAQASLADTRQNQPQAAPATP